MKRIEVYCHSKVAAVPARDSPTINHMSLSSPQGDVLRFEAPDQFGLQDASDDSDLMYLTRLTARLCNCPVAAVLLRDGERQVYRAVHGTTFLLEADAMKPSDGVPFERTVLLASNGEVDQIYEIPDAYLDDAYADTGLAIGGHVYRFYAGTPLVTSDKSVVGTLFVADAVTGTLDPPQQEALTIMSRQVVAHLELANRKREMEVAKLDRHRTGTALTVERNFVSAVLDTVGALVAVFDTAGRVVRFNRACETISGYESAELVGRFVWERLIPKEDVTDAMRKFEAIRAGAFPAKFENHWLTRDGGLRRIAWSATALLDAQGQVAFIIATGIDVTVQHEAEETLVESEARYRLIVEGSLGMIATHDVRGVLLSVNRNGAETLGRTVEQIVGHSLAELLPEGAAKLFQDYLSQITRFGEAQGLLHLRHLNGSIRVIAYRNKMVITPGSEPHVLAFGVDVTDKVRVEAELRALVRQSNSVLESIGDGICGIDLEGNISVVNVAASEMLGYTPEEMLGRSMHDLVHHTRTDGTSYSWESCPVQESLQRMESVRVTTEVFWRKDGSSFPVDYVTRPQIETDIRGGRKVVGLVVAFTDITDRRALDRMKDEFVSTVSHELRTPLTSLRAALGLVHSGTLSSRPEKTKQMLEIAIGNADRLARLVNDIVDLERIRSGKAELHYTMCSMEDLLGAAAVTRKDDAERSNISFEIEASGVKVWADPARIIQVVTNLISNAIKFSPQGGRVLLKAAPLDRNEARIEVRDSGQGIPEHKLEQIFDRFEQVDASDSRSMGGTGLGLTICREIVQQHRGKIWATSKPGKGASFFFTLPMKAKGHLG